MSDNAFDPGRDRDAWGTLRGYLYQVDVTLQRWLDFEYDEMLELERGEDIDLLHRAATASGVERARLLEQVKHLDNSLTLRSGAARAFLANAYAHQRLNSSLRLRFRFTTTSRPGTERPTTMPDGVSGIVAWEQIRRGIWPAEHLTSALGAIRELLTSSAAPADLPADIWASFSSLLKKATDAELTVFIEACEWSMEQVPAGDYEHVLRTRLVTMGLATDVTAARFLYDRLLAFAIRRLTQPGVKRLDRAILVEQIELSRQGVPLSAEDNQQLRELREIVRRLESRVDVVQSAVTDLRVITAHSAAAIDRLARQQGIAASIQYVASVPVLEEPPAVERTSLRTSTVGEILAFRESAVWVALHGISGIGKSQLALLLGRALGGHRVWIRFRDLDVAQSCVRLDAALNKLAVARLPSGGEGFPPYVHAALDALGTSAILVLDDLPRYREGDEFAIRLLSVVRAAADRGQVVLSTSPFRVPSAVLDLFAPGHVLALAAPSFTVQEVREVLAAFGAPELWQNQSLALMVHTVTGGHPTLVRACARDLAVHGWAADTSAIGRILGAQFAEGVNDETVTALIDSAPNPSTRELLFRLNVVNGEFSVEELQSLAEVHPPIKSPRAQMDALLGLWVQSDGGGRYLVSPLVRSLRESELAPETRRDCHRLLGERIVSRRVMGDLEATQALSHFIAAEDFNSAGWLLVRGLVAVREAELPAGVLPVFSHAWFNTPIPSGMDVALRVQIRSLQLGLCIRSGQDPSFLLQDLDALIREIGPSDYWATFTAAIFAAEALAAVNVVGAGRYFLTALRLRPTVVAQLEERGLEAPSMPLEHMIWAMTAGIDGPASLSAWLDVLEAMTREERASAFRPEDIARGGALHVANKLMFREQEKKNALGGNEWTAVLESLRAFTERAEQMELHLLADAAVVTRMTILAEFRNDLTTAEELSEEVLTRPGVDSATTFLVTNSRALLLYDYGPPERALEWLHRAFELRTPVYSWQSVRAAVYLSMRVAASDTRRAVEILTQAAEFADEYAEDAELARAEAYGEKALAEWFVGDDIAAFYSWDKAARALLDLTDESASWKSVFVLFGHISGYFASMASSGRPPEVLIDGEPYAAPQRGLFIVRPEGRDQAFNADRMHILPVQLAMFADAVGSPHHAAYWAGAAETMGKSEGTLQAVALVLPILVAEALSVGDYERAIFRSREKWAIWEANRDSRELTMSARAPHDALGPEGGDLWLQPEGNAMLALIPIYMDLALLAREDPPGARARVGVLTAVLRTLADQFADPVAWNAAADLFEAMSANDVSDRDLVAWGNAYAFRHENSGRALRVVAYLAASERSATPEKTLGLHLAVAPFVDGMVLRESGAIGELAGRYFASIWRERFEAGRFQFSNPYEVERLLDRADEAGFDRPRLVLAAVASGLRVSASTEVMTWLNTHRESHRRGAPPDGTPA